MRTSTATGETTAATTESRAGARALVWSVGRMVALGGTSTAGCETYRMGTCRPMAIDGEER